MPSNKDPSVVLPGAGRLAAGQVSASSISFPFGGAGELLNHLADPTDAHMSGAIGIPETNPVTGQPLLSSVNGPYDGESVMDALTAIADLFPTRPDRIGFDGSIANSGLTNWSNALSTNAIKGGWTDGANGIVTKYLTPNGSLGAQTIGGMVYPADRGVLALYKTTAGDFFNAAQTTLEMALWLGVNPPPAGIPGAAFVEATRPTGQTAYVASGAGLDKISLSARLPYAASYPGLEYTAFGTNFSTYQLGKYSFSITLIAGDNDSYLLVHWKHTYGTSLAAIQPANLTALTLVSTNCFSAVPSDGANYDNANRSLIFLDTASGSGPTPTTITSAPTGTVTVTKYSGVNHYNSTGLQFNITAKATGVFTNSYFTNTVASGSVPAAFTSASTPVQVDMSAFGGTVQNIALYNNTKIVNDAGGAVYTTVAPPSSGHTARFEDAAQGIGAPGNGIPFPYASLSINWNGTFTGPVLQSSTEVYLYNTVGGTLTTQTLEPFNDEGYRHISTFAANNPVTPILPGGGDVYVSATALAANDGNLQVLSGRIAYPSIDFTVAPVNPVTAGCNYAAVLAGDAANHKRRYVRAFNTGFARNTGKLRITGLSFASFDTGIAAVDPAELTDHPGGAIVQIKVPGATGWLDLGRADGLPDLAKVADFRGCRTGIAGDVYTFDTGGFTSDNGSGLFLLFVRVTLIKNGTGQTLNVQEIEWLPP